MSACEGHRYSDSRRDGAPGRDTAVPGLREPGVPAMRAAEGLRAHRGAPTSGPITVQCGASQQQLRRSFPHAIDNGKIEAVTFGVKTHFDVERSFLFT